MDSFQLDVSDLGFSGLNHGNTAASVTITNATVDPIKIHIDTDTDWATVSPSIAGVIVTILVAWLTLRLQRKQTAANLSTLRQQWMSELRTVSSEYVQLLFKNALRVEAKPGYLSSEEFIELHELIAITGTRFEMLLSRDDSDTKPIFDMETKIIDALHNLKAGEECDFILTMINDFKKLIRAELESAWADIKSDVGIKPPTARIRRRVKHCLGWVRFRPFRSSEPSPP
jgi:hypothetical protein